MLDLNTTNFEDVVGRMKAYEERISEEEEEQSDDTGKLMYANSESQQDTYSSGRGRGRGGRSNGRGKGRGRYGGYGGSFQQQREAYRQNIDRSAAHITCFRCDKLGHYAADCPDRLLKLHETAEKKEEETHEADDLMMHEIVYLNEQKIKPSIYETEQDMSNLWYLDNGASNHMSGNRVFFKDLNETITGKVRFGDDSRIDIRGKGSIVFVFDGGAKQHHKLRSSYRSRMRSQNERKSSNALR